VVRRTLRSGVGLVPEDRKRQGLVLMMSGRANFSLVILERLRRLLLLDQRRERRAAEDFFGRLNVKTASIEAPVASLSGGNQQKVVLAKWLACPLKVLIVDEPTRGVDVGAKAAIHALIDELARAGLGILLISSELPELLNLSTRILVMRAGRLVGELPRAAATQENLLRLMAGV
jgi:ABC-type sugar transport system ATPase subunit